MKPWTKEEVYLLEAMCQSMMIKDAAKRLLEMTGRTRDAVFQKARSIGIKRNSKFRRKYSVCDNYFSDTRSLEVCYWAGFIAADGCVGSPKKNCLRIKLKDTDLGHIEKFKKTIGYNGKLHITKKNENTYVCINIHSRKIVDDLVWFKITERKTLTLKPPPLAGDQALAFLIGYIDGDGCIFIENLKNKRTRLILALIGTYEVISWAKKIFDELVPFSTKANPRKTGAVYQYSIASKKALHVLSALEQIDVPKLERKWNKIKKYKESKNEI